MKLTTKRLILRKPTTKDIKDLMEGIGNLNISKHLGKVAHPYKKKDALWWINNGVDSSKKKEKKQYNFNIELKSEKKLIGGIGLFAIDYFNESAEIGYWVAEPYWRKGIISEALLKILDFAYQKLKLRRIVIKAYTTNPSSNGVIKKFGFKLEGTERQANKVLATGEIKDGNVYSLLKKEWPKAKRKLK